MIYIDDRIGSGSGKYKIQDHLRKGIPYTLTHLEYADAMFIGNGPDNILPIGIERKTIGDLLNSMLTGRLTSHQLVGLLRTYQVNYLLVEGIYRSNPRTGILECNYYGKWAPLRLGKSKREYMASMVYNYLNRLAIVYNIKLLETSNLVQTGHLISFIYTWWKKQWTDHAVHAGFHTTPLQPRTLEDGGPVPIAQLSEPPFVQRVIKEFKGVGWKKSEVVMKRFPTVEKLVRANRGHLKSVQGIGKGLADSMYKELREEV